LDGELWPVVWPNATLADNAAGAQGAQCHPCGGLACFVKDPIQRSRNAAELFKLIADGALRIEINQRYGLRDAARAHADLEDRRTTGSTILIPGAQIC
jgi:NADPH:quinone reductase-like Zn-dependent oxidoreductase